MGTRRKATIRIASKQDERQGMIFLAFGIVVPLACRATSVF